MKKSITLEWLKLRHYKAFWILLGMYTLALIVISSSGVFLLEWLKSEGEDFEGIDPTLIPIYDFPDIWQNIIYPATFLKVILAFIIIISVTNDLSYNTLRQNIIDGISKGQYILSKYALIGILAIYSIVLVWICGMVTGYIYSHVFGWKVVLENLEFLLAYGWEIFIYGTLAFLLSLFIKKAGIAIVGLFIYTLMLEPIAGAFLRHSIWTKGTWAALLPDYFPIGSLNNLITIPYGRYIFREVAENVSFNSLFITLIWGLLFTSLIYYRLAKRDLK